MTSDLYLIAVSESSRLKLRATALLAERGLEAGFDASVLFHEAVRAELRAIAALPAPSAETLLRSAIERCGCLIDGRDPSAVIEVAWPEVLEASDQVDATLARSLRSRIDVLIKRFLEEERTQRENAPDLFEQLASPGRFNARAIRQLERLLQSFPGDPRLWTVKALSAVGEGDYEHAIGCTRKAQLLLLEGAPEDRIEAAVPSMESLLCARYGSIPDANAAFEAAYARIRRGPAGADVCFTFVSAGLLLASRLRGGEKRLWERIADIASRGNQKAVDGRFSDFLRAAQMIAFAVLAGRVPSLDILYRAGLGQIASSARSKDPTEVLGDAMAGRILGRAA